ncbi:FAD-binding protein, partial [Gammaproteobacteria bacterium PRO6]|nr:FAD-binding protein [Gammaproteobacteria bacterium PRO6]
MLVCRSEGGSGSASQLAQGGIAAALDPGDSIAAHVEDTLVAGAHHNDAARVQWLCAQAPGVIDWLLAQGVAFDRDADGRLQLGREGGHRCARVVHAGGDATGAVIVRALGARVRAAAHVQWQGGHELEALCLRGGRVCGVRLRERGGATREVAARAVVLATALAAAPAPVMLVCRSEGGSGSASQLAQGGI